jgi:hypothetical protein
MKIKDDDISDFCCSSFDERTKRPDKMIAVLPWRQYQNSVEKWRACMFALPSGIAQSTGDTGSAGCKIIPINFCPFCGAPVSIDNT